MSIDAWVFQRAEQVRDMGEEAAPWYTGWYTPDKKRRCKSHGPGPSGKKKAEEHRAKLEDALMTGNYDERTSITWDNFVDEYTRRVLDGLEITTKTQALFSLGHFKRHMKPSQVWRITTGTIADFTAKRRKDPGKKKGECISSATVNKDLRHIQAALALATEWGYLPRSPTFRKERELERIPRFMTTEHFQALYNVCETARFPKNIPNVSAGDWWRGLLYFIGLTGWRITSTLTLRRDCIDLDASTVLSLAEENKGKRDQHIELHPALVVHLRRIVTFGPVVFPWGYSRSTLEHEWKRLQGVAGIKLVCRKKHQCTETCGTYGFHDLRRMFATLNADNLTAEELQRLMQHKSYETTKLYIGLAAKVKGTAKKLIDPLGKPDEGESSQKRIGN